MVTLLRCSSSFNNSLEDDFVNKVLEGREIAAAQSFL